MLPRTNFDEISAFLKCPSRLYLKLSGYKSEIQRTYTPPSVSPTTLGKQGEEAIRSGFQKEAEATIPEVQRVLVEYPKGGLDDFIRIMTAVIGGNVKTVFAQFETISVSYRSRKVTKVARDLKKKFGITAIIEQIGYTTVPHHFTGRMDFLGLKEDNEVVVIEAKNKADKLGTDDVLQLEYYIAGLQKQYQFTKIREHTHELAAQLYPDKYLNFISYLKKVDLARTESSNLLRIVVGGLETLRGKDREKFIKKYYKGGNDKLPKVESEESLIHYRASENFLRSVPEYSELTKAEEDFRNKASFVEKDFDETSDYIVEIMSRGIKSGLLVDIRRQEIQDTPLRTDFDAAALGVWSVKKNVLKGQPACVKNHGACSYCQYKKTCTRVIREEGELPRVTSVTSIAHKAISGLSYKYKPRHESTFFSGDEARVTHIPARITFLLKSKDASSPLTDAELLQIALSKTEWGYQDWYPKKQGWKTLFVDALASKKLQLEFDFWGI